MALATHPFFRIFQMLEPQDLAKMFNPLEVARLLRDFALGRHQDKGGADPGERDIAFVEAMVDWARYVGQRYFRYKLLGIERIPASGPALLVGNHSGGLVPLDALFIWVAVWDRLGPKRALYGLGHDAVYDIPVLRKYAGRLGILRAGHGGAHNAFHGGHLVLVYPGSEYDSFRPFTERNKVVLADRKGFIKLALRERVPIIPLASVGMQESLIILTRGERLGRALGLHRLIRSGVFPIAFGLPWGLFVPYLPQFPLPAQVTMEFLTPIKWDLPASAAKNDEVVQRCYLQVERALQQGLDKLASGRTVFLGGNV